MGSYRQLSRTTLVNLDFSSQPTTTWITYNFTQSHEHNSTLLNGIHENKLIDLTSETLLKFVLLINKFDPYIYGILGTILNLFLFISYLLKEQKELHKHHMPYFCFANQLTIVTFFLSNVTFLDGRRLVEISSFNCKIFTYLNHIFSTYTAWILANGTFVIKCHINKQSIRLDLNKKFLLVMPFLFSLFYASDLFYLELSNVDGNRFCGVVSNNHIWLLVRDLIDFCVFNFITVCFISYNLCPIKTKDALIPKLKIIIPLVCTLLNFPISFLIFFRDYQILAYNAHNPTSASYIVEFLFTLAHLLSQCDSIIVVIGYVFLFKHYRNVFNCVCCCKCLRWQFFELNNGRSGSRSRSKSRSSRARRNSPNDVLTLDELKKLDLSE